jgi:hypothetical protein
MQGSSYHVWIWGLDFGEHCQYGQGSPVWMLSRIVEVCVICVLLTLLSTQRGGEDTPLDMVLQLAKHSLKLVNTASAKDAKEFVATIKQLKPVLFAWKDESAALPNVWTGASKAQLDEYGEKSESYIHTQSCTHELFFV